MIGFPFLLVITEGSFPVSICIDGSPKVCRRKTIGAIREPCWHHPSRARLRSILL